MKAKVEGKKDNSTRGNSKKKEKNKESSKQVSAILK